MNYVPSMLEDPAEQRRQWLRKQLEMMDLAYRGGEQFIAKQKPGNVVGDRPGVEITNKRNLMGYQ